MTSNALVKWAFLALALGGAGPALAATAWSAQDYDLYPGDFNGDGLTDVLYIAHNPGMPNAIVLSDGAGLNTTLQTWGNAYLGVPWSGGLYNVVVADFDGDGKADILLQRKTPGDSYLLLTEVGGVGAITQTIPQNQAGVAWSGDQHKLIAGDFNGDGRADLFFQALDAKGLNAIVTADASGTFTAQIPAQSWNDGYAGLNWALSEGNVFAADFNGDQRADLLVQAQAVSGGPNSGNPPKPAQFAPNSNGVILAQAGPPMFVTARLQAWSRDGFGADWSPYVSKLAVGDFDGDGRADVLFQGQLSTNATTLLTGRAQGPIFGSASTLSTSTEQSADNYNALVGHFVAGKPDGLYLQARSPTLNNLLASVTGTKFSTAVQDLPSASPSPALASAAPAAAAPLVAAALLTPTSAGRTAGQFAVSAMGAATYSIPVWTPPGARGIQPHLAIVYTSGTPDGPLGPGWSLSGLSSIARCNKTYADNGGAPAAVTLTADDFCLDGNRLRATSGTYGANGTQYQTQIANFSRVTSYGTAGSGPSYFIVEGKDGLIYEYGNTADSKAYASSATTPYAWMLNKVRDREASPDNMVITYSTISGAVQPATISYTQTPSTAMGATYPYTVSFTFQNRVTNLSSYVAGGSIAETQVLSKIDVKSSGTSVRQYNLTYTTAPTTVRDRLSSIQECGGSAGTDCLRATNIVYQNGQAGIGAATLAAGNGSNTNNIRVADIDGDGKDDLLFSAVSGGQTHWWVQFATSSGFGTPTDTGATYSSQSVVSDFLGEGKNSLLAPNGSTFYQYRWTGSAFAATSSSVPVV